MVQSLFRVSYSERNKLKSSTSFLINCLNHFRSRSFAPRLKHSSDMHAAIYIACADDDIGKFNRSMLSRQALMELFIFGLDNFDKICGSGDSRAELCE